MTQNQPKLFSSGLESANLVASSGLLLRSWKAISDVTNSKERLCWKIQQHSDLTIIAFSSAQNDALSTLISSSDPMLKPFQFLYTKSIPTLAVDKSAISIFSDYLSKLEELKSQIDLSKPLIVTGHGFGGSIASLFTLWLLDSVGSGKKNPLCITFGSPLIADQSLQQAISRSSIWNSCFLHVASHSDPLPSKFTSSYKPFGTFLLCYDHGCACFENPDSISTILKAMSHINQGQPNSDYGGLVQNLQRLAISKDSSAAAAAAANVSRSNALQACLTLQLSALGLAHVQNLDIEKKEMVYILRKRKVFDPAKKLNDVKVFMAQLEWYKKISKSQNRGYYDSYKIDQFPADQDVVMFIKILSNYWKDMVAEAEMKPQKEGAAFRTRWLYAGTNYRRMVEPLEIAQYYKDGHRNYVRDGRSEHYKHLEKWLQEEKNNPDSKSKQNVNVESILTFDSCFWAHVEEALLDLKANPKQKLNEFEDYVYEQLKNYAVSPEIFLKESSYMAWWRNYQLTLDPSYDSPLVRFMRTPAYDEKYKKCDYHFL